MTGLQTIEDRSPNIAVICSSLQKLGDAPAPGDEGDPATQVLQAHVATVVRLSITCPYADVREAFTTLIEQLVGLGAIKSRPRKVYQISSYIPEAEVRPGSAGALFLPRRARSLVWRHRLNLV